MLASIALVRLTTGSTSSNDDRETLPTVEVTNIAGETVSTATFVGRPLVINFWYSACAPCATELGDFAAVDAERGDEVRFIGINAIDDVEEMTAFAAERGVDYELFHDRLAELQTQMRLSSFPTTLFVTSDGTVVDRTGVLDEGRLSDRVDALLEADASG